MSSDAGGQRVAKPRPASVHEPATSDMGPPLARHLAQLESSQAAIRDATKWLVAAAAAVGAVLVAGLQLRDLPQGSLATSVALLGVSAALVAIAFIIHRAAGVLVTGYITFGHIADLSEEPRYIKELMKYKNWDERLFRYQAMKQRVAESPAASSGWRRAIWRWLVTMEIKWMKVASRFTIVRAKDEDLRVSELINYLNRDTFYLTQGLASTVNQLYRALVEADIEILSLRGQLIGESVEGEAEGGVDAQAPTNSPFPPFAAKEPAPYELRQADRSAALLEKVEWRRDRLESATRVIVAFRNQKLLEQRFHKLLVAILFGGAIVALGAGAFAAAPKLGNLQSILITQPTQVTVTVIGHSLGQLCPPGTKLRAVAVGGTWEEPLVVTEQTGSCPALQIALNPRQAIVMPILGSSSSSSSSTDSPPSP